MASQQQQKESKRRSPSWALLLGEFGQSAAKHREDFLSGVKAVFIELPSLTACQGLPTRARASNFRQLLCMLFLFDAFL